MMILELTDVKKISLKDKFVISNKYFTPNGKMGFIRTIKPDAYTFTISISIYMIKNRRISFFWWVYCFCTIEHF